MTDEGDDGAGRKTGRADRRARLSEEDRRLWDHVARSVRPARGRGERIVEPTGDRPSALDTRASERAQSLAELQRRLEQGSGFLGSRAAEPPRGGASATSHRSPHPSSPPLAEFDRKAVRRIRSGRIEIEARIDLHGMRQDQACSTLRSFLHGCHARGIRWVLVITGKGRPGRGGAGAAEDGPWGGDQRGVLKRNVPRWLAEPDLRAIVVSYTTASLQHGGEGALYIHLRARR